MISHGHLSVTYHLPLSDSELFGEVSLSMGWGGGAARGPRPEAPVLQPRGLFTPPHRPGSERVLLEQFLDLFEITVHLQSVLNVLGWHVIWAG